MLVFSFSKQLICAEMPNAERNAHKTPTSLIKRKSYYNHFDEWSFGVYIFHYTFRSGFTLGYTPPNSRWVYGLSYAPNYYIFHGNTRGHTLSLHGGYVLKQNQKFNLVVHIGQTYSGAYKYTMKNVHDKNEYIIANMKVSNEPVFKHYWMNFMSLECNRNLNGTFFASARAISFRRYNYKLQRNLISLMPSFGFGLHF